MLDQRPFDPNNLWAYDTDTARTRLSCPEVGRCLSVRTPPADQSARGSS
jgi:hypothetical protein